MPPKKKKLNLNLTPKELFESEKIRAQQLTPNPISKPPRYKTIPPIRTVPLAMQMELTADMPDSIVEVLSSYKPSVKLKQHGIPSKALLAADKIDDLCFISSYLISETQNISDNFLEIFIDHKQMFFWSMAMVFKPNNPYLAIVAAEENSSAALTFATYLASYYLSLSEKHSNEMLFKWYRSLEFVKYSKSEDSTGVIIIQCRWPSWVDNREKLLRNILNIRAVYENATVILIMQEEDLSLAPYLLNDEPFGLFLKVGKKEDLGQVIAKKTTSTPINKIMKRIKMKLKE